VRGSKAHTANNPRAFPSARIFTKTGKLWAGSGTSRAGFCRLHAIIMHSESLPREILAILPQHSTPAASNFYCCWLHPNYADRQRPLRKATLVASAGKRAGLSFAARPGRKENQSTLMLELA
jgi:hypothetical protein